VRVLQPSSVLLGAGTEPLIRAALASAFKSVREHSN
jgi:hypothetical protein